MRIAIAGFMHESNTFNSIPTDRVAFASQSLVFGSDLVKEWRDAHHEVGGFLEAAECERFEPVPILMAWATPSGPVTDGAFDEITRRLVDGVQDAKPDGLLLALHGAMVAESYLDADGEIVARLRCGMGPDFPIVLSLDLHGNLSPRLIAQTQAAVAYRTYPHVDQRECGRRAASLLARHLRGQIRLSQALAKPPVIVNIMAQDTSKPPMREIMGEARDLERLPGILAASVLPGFPYADVPQMGPSVVVVADGDVNLAQGEADKMAHRIWNAQAELTSDLPDAATAVHRALHGDRFPVVLVDCGDNVGGGSAGDGTFLLDELLRQGATGVAICLYSAEELLQCTAAGVGATVHLNVGGKVDRNHGPSLTLTGAVRLLHDGTYMEAEARHGGRRTNQMGKTAVVELSGSNLLVLNSERHPPFSLGQLTCLGIDPRQRRFLVVKAAIAYKAAYGPIAGTTIEVDTPGLTAVNPRRFSYRHIRHPMFPLD